MEEIMNETWNYAVKLWLEFWGSLAPARAYPIPEKEIVSPEYTFTVSPITQAKYLRVHPNQFAVSISPFGKVQNMTGGINHPLSAGKYIIHFIDKRNRKEELPKITETTLDGARITLAAIITYRVIDPIKALESEKPVETLYAFIQSDLKDYIRSHQYDDLVGNGSSPIIDSSQLGRYIKQQHSSRHQISKVFAIIDIAFQEKEGDPRIVELRKNFQVQQKEKLAETALFKQNQELEIKLTEQEAEVKRIKAEAEVREKNILQKLKMQELDLQKARNELQLRQDKWLGALEVFERMLSTPYPRDQREINLIKELLDELREMASPPARPAADKPAADSLNAGTRKIDDKIDSLTKTILSLLDRKKPG